MIVLHREFLLDHGFHMNVDADGNVVIEPPGEPDPETMNSLVKGLRNFGPDVDGDILTNLVIEAANKAATQQLLCVINSTPSEARRDVLHAPTTRR